MRNLTDKDISQILMRLRPQEVVAFDSMDPAIIAAVPTLDTYAGLGVNISLDAMDFMIANPRLYPFAKAAMDAAPTGLTTSSTGVPLQFLQHFLAKPVKIVTRALKADEVIGRTIAGTWADAQVVQPIIELKGQARDYGDQTNIPLSSYNFVFEARDIVRFEEGAEVGKLEQERAAKMRLNAFDIKRSAAAGALAISMNRVAFYGYNDGSGRTYGLLNDPGLPEYVSVATGASGDTLWSKKTGVEIYNDILAAMNALMVRSGYHFDPYTSSATLAVAGNVSTLLSKITDLGISIRETIAKTFPKLRIVPVPEFEDADGGENVFYVIADEIGEDKVADQFIQDTLRMLGMEMRAKSVLEDYANATAGTMFMQPIGVVCYTGI